MQIKLKIDSYEDRNKMVTALANAGIPVHVEQVSGKDNCLHRFDYYVVFSHTDFIEIEKECPETNKEYKVGGVGPAGGIVFMQHEDGTFVECRTRDEPNRMTWDQARERVKTLNRGGFSDWSLPTIDELDELYMNKDQIGKFQHDYYWSDTEHSEFTACNQHFYTGDRYYDGKNFNYRVRAVRRFK